MTIGTSRDNLQSFCWTPCDPHSPNSEDAITLTYADSTVTYRGGDARLVREALLRRLKARAIAVTILPRHQEVAA